MRRAPFLSLVSAFLLSQVVLSQPAAEANPLHESIFQPQAKTASDIISMAATRGAADDPDDVYWDTSMSATLPGFDGEVLALTVYDGKLVAGEPSRQPVV